ncbi:hypothetical protein QTN47_25185 [Danxiaibacter flavus]|uniref:Uncharacterized protein n=1 Tax=Danxiaibacter flavus TaxID=3049108 RepID=A0ABV3ZLQ7_9BACT|nr:hypothetical protein QNM32_25190 [Chitinophagaceae bacterium DXS]
MTPRSFFNIILKIFGLFFLKEIVNIVLQLISSSLYFTRIGSAGDGVWTFFITALILAFYAFIVFQLLFKTNYLLDKLELDKGFSQEEFSFTIPASLVLTIALIVTGGIILTNEIPNLCRQVFTYFQEKRLSRGTTTPEFSYAIIAGVKIIIGFLLIGERERIVKFIESRQNKKEQVSEKK